ncbi:MAG: hypothetical protein K2X44_05030, partial [Magnetospirillum sp.]|nr:hypothetical protein [Magnetospirillum sp.]
MMKFSDIPLLFKVILSPLTAIIALVGVAILGIVNANGLETRLTTLNDVVFQEVQQGLELKDSVGIFHAHLFALMSAAVNETDVAKRDRAVKDLMVELKAVTQSVNAAMSTTAGSTATPNLAKIFKNYQDAAQVAIDMGATDAAYGVMMMGATNEEFLKLRKEIETLNRVLGDERTSMVSSLRDQGRASGRQTVLVAALVSLASIAAALIISRQIAHPIT